MVKKDSLILQPPTWRENPLGFLPVLSFMLFLVSIFTGYILWLMTKKKGAKWCTDHNLKKKVILKYHCYSSYFALILGILHGIIEYQECGTLWSPKWFVVYIMIILCFTGVLFPKLSQILPNISRKIKKTILRIIHFSLQIIVLVIIINFSWL